MPVYDNHKLIFHHIPKTGGRAIDRWLGGADANLGHVPIFNMINELQRQAYSGKGYRLTFPSFTVVRDPVDRIRSAWMHHKREQRDTLKDWPHLFDCSFEKAVLHNDFINLLKDGIRSVHFYPLSWMFSKLEDLNTNIQSQGRAQVSLPDFSLNFDCLEKDCAILADAFSLDVEPFIFSATQYEKRPLEGEAFRKFQWLYASDYKFMPHLSDRSIAKI